MQSILSSLRAEALAGLGAVCLNLIIAGALVVLSLVLCALVGLLTGLPAPVQRPQGATEAPRRRR